AVVLHHPLRLGAAQRAGGAPPLVIGALDGAAAFRADHGVVVPALAGAEPDHRRVVDGGPDDEGVVGVGDDAYLGVFGEGRPPALREHGDFLRAVELVA